MKFVMTQAVCPEGLQMLDGVADVYVADNQDPNNREDYDGLVDSFEQMQNAMDMQLRIVRI